MWPGPRLDLRESARAVMAFPLLLGSVCIYALCRPWVKRFFLVVLILNIPLQWGTNLDLRASAAEYGAIEGFDFSLTTIALLVLYAGWLFGDCAVRRPLRLLPNWPILVYTLTVAASMMMAHDIELALFSIYFLIEAMLLYFFISSMVRSREEIVSICRLLLVGGFIEGLYMVAMKVVGHEIPVIRAMGLKTVIFTPTHTGELLRPGGTIGGPNYAAAYLAVVLVLALAVVDLDNRRTTRRLRWAAAIATLPALCVTLSRGAWIQLVLSVVIYVGARWMRYGVPRKGVAVMVLLVAALMIGAVVPNPIRDRLTADDNGSAHARLPLIHLATNMIEAHPLLGVGANNFSTVMGAYEGSEFRHEWIYTVHDQFFLVGAENGLIGLAAYLWIYFNAIRRGWRLWQARDEVLSPYGLFVVAALLGFLSHMFVESFSSGGLVEMVWLFAALIACSEVILRGEITATARPLVETKVLQAAG
jgi:O-antigen ligase